MTRALQKQGNRFTATCELVDPHILGDMFDSYKIELSASKSEEFDSAGWLRPRSPIRSLAESITCWLVPLQHFGANEPGKSPKINISLYTAILWQYCGEVISSTWSEYSLLYNWLRRESSCATNSLWVNVLATMEKISNSSLYTVVLVDSSPVECFFQLTERRCADAATTSW